jgi:NTE family protein
MTRRGLVLGAGGVLGAAWTIGALTALEEVEGFDARDCEVLIGTSAGSVLAALLGAGISVRDVRDHQLGRPVAEGPLKGYSLDYDKATGGTLPGLPRLGIGSRRLLVQALRRPGALTPFAAMSSLVPEGSGSLWTVGHLVDAVTPHGEWSPHDNLWLVAMDYDTGRRVVFGREGSPPAELSEAVLASCAIPGWFKPMTIGGRRYVDGGTCSATSVDLLAGQELDEVYVLAPMASFDYDEPTAVAARIERAYRRSVTRRMMREAGKVRDGSDGATTVTMLGPGRLDLEAIGVNLMDHTRRESVLEVSLQTSADALRRARADELSWSA